MLLTQYLAQQPHIAKASGVAQEVVEQIQSILGWPATKEQIQQAKHLVPEELIHRISASGTPAEARRLPRGPWEPGDCARKRPAGFWGRFEVQGENLRDVGGWGEEKGEGMAI
jgi:hypothetical protein